MVSTSACMYNLDCKFSNASLTHCRFCLHTDTFSMWLISFFQRFNYFNSKRDTNTGAQSLYSKLFKAFKPQYSVTHNRLLFFDQANHGRNNRASHGRLQKKIRFISLFRLGRSHILYFIFLGFNGQRFNGNGDKLVRLIALCFIVWPLLTRFPRPIACPSEKNLSTRSSKKKTWVFAGSCDILTINYWFLSALFGVRQFLATPKIFWKPPLGRCLARTHILRSVLCFKNQVLI